MCKTCGCSDGTLRLLDLTIRSDGADDEVLSLGPRLLGLQGVLHVREEKEGRFLVDFDPRLTSPQILADFAAGCGFIVTGAAVRETEHRHGVVAFLRRMTGR